MRIITKFPKLYKKEKLTLKILQKCMLEHNFIPSFEEIQSFLGKKSLGTIYKSLKQLERKGYIERKKHYPRSITLTDLAVEYFGLKKDCRRCGWWRNRNSSRKGVSIPDGTGKCTRPEGHCDPDIVKGKIGEGPIRRHGDKG